MKLVIASDIHGVAERCAQLMELICAEQPDRVVLLGDVLYHGPRNDLPPDYAPKKVIAMLNSIAERIIAVRGNCEAEVDQMVLDFPCMSTSNTLFDPACGMSLFFTHGHVYGPGLHNSVHKLPQLPANSALIYGHTHIKVNQACEEREGLWLFNPGSVGIPKDGSHSCGVYEGGRFEHRILGKLEA